MEFIFSIVSGLISGVVASLLFYLYMRKMRPKIFICDDIALSNNEEGPFYGFKLYNESKKYDVLDLRFELFIITPFNSHGGRNYKIDKLKLKREHIMSLSKCSKENEKEGSFALVMTTREDLETLWNKDSQILEFHVHARHSFSGATHSFSKKFYTKSTSIKQGMFTFGKTNAVK